VPCFAPVWEPAIKQVIAELGRAGVKPADIPQNPYWTCHWVGRRIKT